MQKEFSMNDDHNQFDTIMLDVKLKFSRSEVEEYLTRTGYALQEYKHSTWVPEGPYDSTAKLVVNTYQCAVRSGDSPGLHNLYMDVFESIVTNRFKKLILE